MRQKYPAIIDWLLGFESKAKKRYDKGQFWWELRACDYYEEFEMSKIIIPAIVKGASYACDQSGIYSNDKTTIIPTKDLGLLAILNSKIVDFYFKSIASTKQNGYFEYKPVYVSQLPIVKEETNSIHTLVEKILSLDEGDNAIERRELEEKIHNVVCSIYGLTETEIEIILNNC